MQKIPKQEYTTEFKERAVKHEPHLLEDEKSGEPQSMDLQYDNIT